MDKHTNSGRYGPVPIDRSFVDAFTPGPAGQQILHTVAKADLDTVPRPIKLDRAARLLFVDALNRTELEWGDPDSILGAYIDDPEDPDWGLIEQALGDIVSHLYPARYVTGIDHAAGDPGRP